MDGAIAISILSRLHDAVVTIDQQQRIAFFNDAAEMLFGYPRSEVIGQPLERLIPDALRDGHRRHVADFGRSGDTARMMASRGAIQARRRDGSTFPAAASITKVPAGDGVVFAAVLRDISDQVRVENQLRHAQRMESIGQLTGGIAHDFNNLLAVVIGSLELAKERTDDPAALNKQLDAAIGASLRGAELVQRLLAFARRKALAPVAIDLNQRVPEMIAMLQRAIGDHIEIKVALRPNLWPARVDPTIIDDALLNLAINARDAMPEGGTLTIETANVQFDRGYAESNVEVAPGDYVMVAVTDTGTGMAPAVAERAFEPFFTTKTVGKGSGLGLSMVYGSVKQSGGHVKIYSEPLHGTTVKIYLPRSAEAAAAPAEMRREALPRGGETVLVAEDNAAMRATIEQMLAELGYRVHAVPDGPAALSWLERGAAVDLLLTDIVMPGGLSGYALAAAAEKIRPGLKILLSTGYAEGAVRNGHENGKRPVLGKPYSMATLAQALRRVLDGPDG